MMVSLVSANLGNKKAPLGAFYLLTYFSQNFIKALSPGPWYF